MEKVGYPAKYADRSLLTEARNLPMYTGKGKCAVVYYKEQNMSLLPILAHTDWATCLPWPDRSHPTALAPDFWSPAARCASGKNPAQWWGNTAWCTG